MSSRPIHHPSIKDKQHLHLPLPNQTYTTADNREQRLALVFLVEGKGWNQTIKVVYVKQGVCTSVDNEHICSFIVHV